MIRFVTGTDTGVGKTAVAAALAQECARGGRAVTYFKPVQTGVEVGAPGDAQFVAACCSARVVEGCRYPAPLAPAEAARQAGATVPWAKLVDQARALAAAADLLLVEGAGGLLVPFDDRHSMADFAIAVDAELVVVARPSLGTLNHTALTLQSAAVAKLRVAEVVVSDWPLQPGVTEQTNLERIKRMAPERVRCLAAVEELDTGMPAAVEFRFFEPELYPGWK